MGNKGIEALSRPIESIFPGSTRGLLIAAGLAVALSGCGVSVGVGGQEEDSGTTEAALIPNERQVVIDWDAGASVMRDGDWMTPVDLGAFHLPDGWTLADEPNFQVLVEGRIQTIFDDLEPADIRVVTADANEYPEATVVLMTFEADPDDPQRVGQAYYDPCDTEPADEAIVWGLAMLELGDGHRLDEWVNLFANVAAHEVAHTLGFAHPEAIDHLGFRPHPSALMLGSHTLSALLQEQSFQIPQQTCPGDLLGLDEVYAGYQVPVSDSRSQLAGSARTMDPLDSGPDVACTGW